MMNQLEEERVKGCGVIIKMLGVYGQAQRAMDKKD